MNVGTISAESAGSINTTARCTKTNKDQKNYNKSIKEIFHITGEIKLLY